MKTLKPFFKGIWESFNPNAYQHLSARDYSTAFQYFMSLIIIAFFVLTIVSIPSVATLPNKIGKQIDKFSLFDLNSDIEMTGPIKIGEFATIDTTGTITNMTTEKIFITEDTLYFRPLWKTKVYDLETLNVLSNNKEKVVKFIWTLFILMLPGIALLVFVAYLLKYLVVILLSVLVAFIITKLLKLDSKLRHLIKIGFYAATPMILGDLILSRFWPGLIGSYLIPFGLFGFYFVVGIALNSEKAMEHKGSINDKHL